VDSRFEIPCVLAKNGLSKPLVVTDAKLAQQPLFADFLCDLKVRGLHTTPFAEVSPNPLDVDIANGARAYRQVGADCIIAIGGGSGMDSGKSIAMVAESGLSLQSCDYFSESPPVANGGRLVPCITVPTTAGTGAEMDSGSMYTDTAARVKRCAGHTSLSVTAVLDPVLTLGLPPSLTAWTGMDALVHALEALFVPVYHPMCDAIALQALGKIRNNLLLAYSNNQDVNARMEMLVASAMAAVSFQKGLGAVHGLSEPLGAVYDVHHGLANAVILPHMLRDLAEHIDEPCGHIVRALRLPPAVGGNVASVIQWVDELVQQLEIPTRLSDVAQIEGHHIPELAGKAADNPTGFTNALRYSVSDYERVIRRAL